MEVLAAVAVPEPVIALAAAVDTLAAAAVANGMGIHN
jgi:hypothetical protein